MIRLLPLLPFDSAERVSVRAALLGASVEFVRLPRLWLFGPLRWLSLVLATIAYESGGDSDARGDLGRTDVPPSRGILQFQPATIEMLGFSAADADRPFTAGRAAARNVDAALRSDFLYWSQLFLPVVSIFRMRQLWKAGQGSRWPLSDAASAALYSKSDGFSVWLKARIASSIFCFAVLSIIFAGRR